MKDYLENFPKKANLPHTKKGFFVINRGLIKRSCKGSLNLKNKIEVSGEYEMGFISLELLVKLYEIKKENPHILRDPKMASFFNLTFENVFNKSINAKNTSDLDRIETSAIKKIITKIDKEKESYLPQKFGNI